MVVELFYYAISPPARACELVLLLEKIEHKLTTVDLFAGEQKKPDFVAINPAHCIPTLKDGDFVVWESRAIMQYLMNKFAPESRYDLKYFSTVNSVFPAYTRRTPKNGQKLTF